MAIVKTFTASNGVTVIVDDAFYRDLSAQQRSARKATFYAECRRIIERRVSERMQPDAANPPLPRPAR